MAKIKRTTAGKVLIALMVMALMLAACGNVFISASAAGSYGNTIYLKTTDTTDPYIYFWIDGNTSVGPSWPGVKMQPMGGETDVYFYDLPCDVGDLSGVIFCNGSGGNKMTGDVTNITGNLYILNGSAGTWDTYDTSDLRITSYGADVKSPQYTGSSIGLYITAESPNGGVEYKISVSGAQDVVVSDYSANGSVVWTPTVAGDYTVLFETKDAAGNTNSRQTTFTIKDSSTAEEPVFLGAYPANNAQIKKGSATTVQVNGAGGQINTKLLFYKTEVTDPDGLPVNTVYYQLGNQLTFNADKLGTYTVKMTIQNSSVNNKTTSQTYTYNSVNDLIDTDTDVRVPVTGVSLNKTSASLTVGGTTTLTATVNPTNATNRAVTWSSDKTSVATVSNGVVKAVGAGTATITVKTSDGGFTATCVVTVTKPAESDTDTTTDTGTDTDTDTTTDTDTDTGTDTDTDTDTDGGILGDVDNDGRVTMKDASMVQRYTLGLGTLTNDQKKRADVNKDGNYDLKDASLIQRYTLKLVTFN